MNAQQQMVHSGHVANAALVPTGALVPFAGCEVCGGGASDLELCVGCGRWVCPGCRSQEGRAYWSLGGRKGYSCQPCLSAHRTYEGGALWRVGQTMAQVQDLKNQLVGDAHEFLSETRDEAHGLLDRVETQTGPALLEAARVRVHQELQEGLDRIEKQTIPVIAREFGRELGRQRAEALIDAEARVDRIAVKFVVLLAVAACVALVAARVLGFGG